jgi:hypothetical protein
VVGSYRREESRGSGKKRRADVTDVGDDRFPGGQDSGGERALERHRARHRRRGSDPLAGRVGRVDHVASTASARARGTLGDLDRDAVTLPLDGGERLT